VANAYFGAAGGWDVMILGFSVVAIVMTDPRGLCFLVQRLWQAVSRRSKGRFAAGNV
jgi:hypothetical protein